MRSPWIPVVLNILIFVFLAWIYWLPVVAFDDPGYHFPKQLIVFHRVMIGHWGIPLIVLGFLLSLLALTWVSVTQKRRTVPKWIGITGICMGLLNVITWSVFFWAFIIQRIHFGSLLKGL